MDKENEFLGEFFIDNKKTSFGKLSIDGENTLLTLALGRETISEELETINGILSHNKKSTCLKCITTSSSSNTNNQGVKTNQVSILPNFVTIGNKYLNPKDKNISSISFTTQDIEKILHNTKSFGHIIDSREFVDLINKSSKINIKLHDHPEFFYFTGKFEIIKIDTTIGVIELTNNPVFFGSGSNGKFLENTIRISLEFPSPLDFSECLSNFYSLNRYFNLIAGREQDVKNIKIHTSNDIYKSEDLDLFFSNTPDINPTKENPPHPADIPINPISRQDEFKTVTRNWFNIDEKRKAARIRYNLCLNKGNSYSIDRIVAAANMFDILPDETFPVKKTIPHELELAKVKCREIFKNLPSSPERDSILGALGRINKPSLTSKALCRERIVSHKIGAILPDLDLVIKIAIKVRNYFVHGSDGIRFNKLEPAIPFLTDALEFTFAASDLIECGWQAEEWVKGHFGFGHSFTRFIHEYKNELERLKITLKD
ncbi:hypothetical protein B4923_11715 [Brenneria roseae subsp. americana]|uniref:Uncharacterized protein n=1 Tax=Brenneria roseae subsp. americana TaxID=1508507 RepID=A0A2U1TRD5_9GAMM|nr:HEPN domain-containing protein [Brenneria roseae]PWC11970.1 hypothetical protein B4923_11715 [Brenneria roseae subsp. americana]